MAARKSCTKLTWAEAKAKVGESSGSGGGKKKPNGVIKNHATHQANKIITKNDTRSDNERIKDRQAARLVRKDMERQEYLNAQREAKKEQAKIDQLVKPYDLAIERLSKLTIDHCGRDNGNVVSLTTKSNNNNNNNIKDDYDIDQLCECKSMQLDEILALEAIYDDGAELEPLSFVTHCRLDDQRRTVEEWQMNEDNQTLQESIRDLPPISFTLKLLVDDTTNDNDDTDDTNNPSEEERLLVAVMLLQVTFPPLYPLYEEQIPQFDVLDCMVVDKVAVCNRNKPLESLRRFQPTKFVNALNQQAFELHGIPCVYEIVGTWLSEQQSFFSTFFF